MSSGFIKYYNKSIKYISSYTGASANVAVDEASVEQITSMGFTSAQAARALRSTDGDVARALDWIFSHADQLDSDVPSAPVQDRTLGCRDGPES